jgi:hypothetical protein
VRAMLAEVHRVLTPTGLFITIAFGQVHIFTCEIMSFEFL